MNAPGCPSAPAGHLKAIRNAGRLVGAIAMVALLTLPACGTEPRLIRHEAHTDSDVPTRFQIGPDTVPWEKSPTRELKHYTFFQVRFPSPVKTDSARNNVVHGEFFRPLGDGPYPAVVVLHILGGDFELSRICCRALAAHGVAALFVKMPHYGPRHDPDQGEEMISADAEATVANMTQAVKDIRRGADWLCSRERVDPHRLGITGISLGGIVASLAAGVEPRFRRGCFMLAGADLSHLVANSSELADVRAAWSDREVTETQVATMLAPVDPLTYAHRLRGRKLLLFNARHDTVVPRRCTEALWEAAGKPELVWWNAGHYSSGMYLPNGVTRMVRFFAAE